MNYEQFKTELKERLEQELGDRNITIHFDCVAKNNGHQREVIIVHEEGKTLTPSIGLRMLFQRVQAGEDFETIIDEIKEIVDNEPDFPLFVVLRSWEVAKDKIFIKLINYEWNKEKLKGIPHQRIEDLASICFVKLEDSDEGVAGVEVKQEMLTMWDISEEELWEAAYNNLQKEKVEVTPMMQIISEIVGEKLVDDGCGLYVLSAKRSAFGASALLRKDVLETFGDKQKKNFYVLPSSINELILCPELEDRTVDELRAMVREINYTQVPLEERLSDEVYLYDYEEKLLKIA